jgi:hypothetical protein
MKNAILLAICLFFALTNIHAQEIIINERYKNFEYKFQKLDSDEILAFTWNNFSINGKEYTFRLFAKNIKTGETRLLGYWYIGWGQYQFSGDRKTAIFFLNASSVYNRPLCFIDGNMGTIKYVMDINLSARTNLNLQYILVTDYPERDTGGNSLEFGLIDLQNVKYIRTIRWNIKEKLPYTWAGIYRDINKSHDFLIDYTSEGSLVALCYYTVSSDTIDTVFDYSDLSYKHWPEDPHRKWPEFGIPDAD